MAFSPAEPHDGGYATAAAVTFGMALALIISALTVLDAVRLHAARADLDQLDVERVLASARQVAAVAIMKNSKSVRLGWPTHAGDADVRILAEPEAAKLSYDAAAKLDDAALANLGVTDPAALKARLLTAASAADDTMGIWPAELDEAPMWRACAGSLLSAFGQATTQTLTVAAAPDDRAFSWRLGEVWKIQAISGGWAETTLVRFTGDAKRPAAVIARAMARHAGGDRSCDIQLGEA